MLVRQHERFVEELNVQLDFKQPITSSGAVMTLPAATADVRDWIADQRKFLSVQCIDWMQVIGDFGDSLAETGPKLSKHVETITTQIKSQLPKLISPSTPDPVPSPIASFLQKLVPSSLSDRIAAPIDSLLQKLVPRDATARVNHSYSINDVVRADISQRLEQLDVELATAAATIAAWRDLVSSAKKVKRKVEEVSFRRDTLYAIAKHRNLDVTGSFGVFATVSSVLTDVADTVLAEEDKAAGVDHEPVDPQALWKPSGVQTWRRLQLCEQVLAREPYRAHCIVWLRLAPTSLPQHEVTHGQVTFYNAAVLSGCIGHPELADQFAVPPMEVLTPLPPEREPIVPEGEVEWEDDYHMTYARVVLPDIEVHAAEATARTLVEGLKAVNHATKDTWRLLKGTILFIDGERHSLFSWGPKEDIPERFQPLNDWMGRDIERMARNNRFLDAQSMHELQDAIGMSTTLKAADDESAQATVMAAVRAIEHVNAWTTGGVKNWVDFASDYFKKAQARVRVVEFISYFTMNATNSVPDRRPNAPREPQQELFEIRSKLGKFEWPHGVFHVRGGADEVAKLHRIYADHWLERGLGELETTLASPTEMYARLDEQCRRFDHHLKRLKRLRNSAIHGGPVSDTGCESVAVFAYNLGHQCLNEAMYALLTGRDIPSHMDDYRTDHIERFKCVQTTGDVDALFVEVDIDEADRDD